MWRQLYELLIPSVCPGCDRARRSGQPLLCGRCRRGLLPCPEQDRVLTAVAYTGTGARLVQRFKFDGRRDALAVLAEALATRVDPIAVDAIVPVPRHPDRIRSQGGEPVFHLGRELSRRLRTPLLDGLTRVGPSRSQTGLSQRARRANVVAGFALRACSRRLAGRRILLVDDVTTTGATLASAARLLIEGAGARSVARAALAATPAAAGGTLIANAHAPRGSGPERPLPSPPAAAL